MWMERNCFLGPREVMGIQRDLGSDIAMVLDECPPWPCERSACEQAVARSQRWAAQCRQIAEESGFLAAGHLVFGIAQGSTFDDLRREAAEGLAALDFSGYAVGGVSVGEPEPEMLQQVAATTPFLPAHQPRYTMGLGTPPQLLKMIALGVDMFDCVLPTRVARNGLVFTPDGPMNLRNEQYRTDARPIVEGLDNYTCRTFSRAYLRHVTIAGEIAQLHPAHAAQPAFLPRPDGAGASASRGGRLRAVAPGLDRAVRSGRRGADRLRARGPSRLRARRSPSCDRAQAERRVAADPDWRKQPRGGWVHAAPMFCWRRRFNFPSLSSACEFLSPVAPASSAPIFAIGCSPTAMRSSAIDNLFTGRKQNIEHLFGNTRFEFVRHDVIDPFKFEVDQIYNLACPASPPHYQYNPIKTIKTSVMGAINCLGLAKRLKARVLQASTSEVYGDPSVHPQPESYWGNVNPIGRRSCYDEGKRCAETLFFDYHRENKVDIRVVRIFNTYGPRMHEDDGRVVSNFIVQALRGEDLTIYGDGSQTRSFCYVDDLIEGFVRCMAQTETVGSDEPRQSGRIHHARARRAHAEAGRRPLADRAQAAAAGRPEAAAAGHRAGAGGS